MKKRAFTFFALSAVIALTGCGKQVQKKITFYTGYEVEGMFSSIPSNLVKRDEPEIHSGIRRACLKNAIEASMEFFSKKYGAKINGSSGRKVSYKKDVWHKNYPDTYYHSPSKVTCFAETFVVEGPASKLDKRIYNQYGDEVIMLR